MILVRHGESHFNARFNVTRRDPGIWDPSLTPRGRAQAIDAARVVEELGTARRIISSPYWRTLQTAEVLAERLDLPVEIDPLVRERAFFACDIGSPRSALRARWPGVAFQGLPEYWWPSLNESDAEVSRRGQEFRRAMLARGDWEEAVVVSHWGFIRALVGREISNGSVIQYHIEEQNVRLHHGRAAG